MKPSCPILPRRIALPLCFLLLGSAPTFCSIGPDFDGDGSVGFSDFLLFLKARERGSTAADLDGDGRKGFGDFLVFARAYGRTLGALFPKAVKNQPADPTRTLLQVLVTRDGLPLPELEISLSRSISGKPTNFQWEGRTDGEGYASLEITDSRSVTGYYSAKGTDPNTGEVLDRWTSLPITAGKLIQFHFSVGGPVQVLGAEDIPPPNPSAVPSVAPIRVFMKGNQWIENGGP